MAHSPSLKRGLSQACETSLGDKLAWNHQLEQWCTMESLPVTHHCSKIQWPCRTKFQGISPLTLRVSYMVWNCSMVHPLTFGDFIVSQWDSPRLPSITGLLSMQERVTYYFETKQLYCETKQLYFATGIVKLNSCISKLNSCILKLNSCILQLVF